MIPNLLTKLILIEFSHMPERGEQKESNLDKKLMGYGGVAVLVGWGFKIGLVTELGVLAIAAGAGVYALKGKKEK